MECVKMQGPTNPKCICMFCMAYSEQH